MQYIQSFAHRLLKTYDNSFSAGICNHRRVKKELQIRIGKKIIENKTVEM